MRKLLLLLPATVLLAACEPAALASFTAVGATGAYINHKEKGAPLSVEDTKAAIKRDFSRDKFVGFEVNN